MASKHPCGVLLQVDIPRNAGGQWVLQTEFCVPQIHVLKPNPKGMDQEWGAPTNGINTLQQARELPVPFPHQARDCQPPSQGLGARLSRGDPDRGGASLSDFPLPHSRRTPQD